MYNDYSFNSFIEKREKLDFYKADPFVQKAFKYFSKEDFEVVEKEAERFSPKVSFRWKKLVERMSRPENRPYLIHYDAYGNRVDEIVRPLKEVFSEAIFSETTSPWVRLLKMFLIYQLGEACISCPLVCTEGLIALLERFADTSTLKHILVHCKEGIEGDFGIGAQYLSEIHGGSDVPANRVEAHLENGSWRIYGDKFFCSATHADYAVVTARVHGTNFIGAFVVPSWDIKAGKSSTS